MTQDIQRLPRVEQRVGFARATIYQKKSEGTFPPPIALGPRAVGWLSHEIDAWIEARASGKTDTEIRELVAKLVAERTAVKAGGSHE